MQSASLQLTDEAAIATSLRGPAGRFVESGCALPHRAPGLCVVVRTDTAFRLPLAAIVLGAITERVTVEPATTIAIELALHEAVANAVMHGNLQIHSNGRGDIRHYARFCTDIHQRLIDPDLAQRRVIVNAWHPAKRLCFAVSDEGDGFAGTSGQPAADQPHGRGIQLMRQLAQRVSWNQRRRRMILIFATAATTA